MTVCSATAEPIHPDPGPPRSWLVRVHAGEGAAPGADYFGACVFRQRPGDPHACEVLGLVVREAGAPQTAVHRALRAAARGLGFRRGYYERREGGVVRLSRVVEL